MRDKVILVDENDKEIGVIDKLLAHQSDKYRHRAFSIFIFSKGRLLLQKRALHKYHAPGLWSNSCCSHPQPGENILNSAQQRLKEELGFSTELQHIGCIEYKEPVGALFEWEYDHLFIGFFDGELCPDKNEVSKTRWVKIETLEAELLELPDLFTPWLKHILPKLRHYLATGYRQ